MPQKPLYTTRGDWAGMLIDANLYSPKGEWIGWATPEGQVYSVAGVYVGWLSKDFRVLRKRVSDSLPERRAPAARPALKVSLPTSAPLPPLMSDLPFDTVDVFDEMPERLHTVDDDPDAKDMD